MWRISAFILAAFIVSCAGTSEKDRLRGEGRKEASDLGEPEDARSQLSAQLESLKQIRSQMEQELATKKADSDELKKRLEDITKRLESLDKERKECKSLLDKGAQKSPSKEGKDYLKTAPSETKKK
jgi:septal ring factor EnvC (AmiA/AmiB activator)